MRHVLNTITLIIALTTDDNINKKIKRLGCCYIVKMALTQHKSCAFQGEKYPCKNRMLGLNLDDDHETIKSLHCFVKGKKAEDAKDSRRLNAAMIQLPQYPGAKLDEMWACPNSLRSMKGRRNSKHEEQNYSKVQNNNDDDSCSDPSNENVECNEKARSLKSHAGLIHRRKKERTRVTNKLMMKISSQSQTKSCSA